MTPTIAHGLVLGIVALSLALMLLRPRNWPEVAWVGSGALLLVLLRLMPLRDAGRALAAGTDVYLFLTGMMLLSELARENGVFDWVSSLAVQHARGSSTRLFLLIYLVGAVVTIAMSNDATAVVLTPAVLAAVRRARVPPLPFLFACALIANAASFVLPISNPANLVVFDGVMPPLGRWLAAFLLPSAAAIAVTYLVLRVYFRRELAAPLASDVTDGVALSADGHLVVAGLGLVVAVLLAASALNLSLGLPTCLAAVAVTTVVCLRGRQSPHPPGRLYARSPRPCRTHRGRPGAEPLGHRLARHDSLADRASPREPPRKCLGFPEVRSDCHALGAAGGDGGDAAGRRGRGQVKRSRYM